MPIKKKQVGAAQMGSRKPVVQITRIHQHGDTHRIAAMAGVVSILNYIGEDCWREGLRDTPARVVKAWKEMTVGYSQDPAEILARDFDGGGYDEVICVPNIELYSTCEHHMIPFHGVAHVAYLPRKRVVGLSKLARLVDCFARRLQIQEQLTMQVADAIQTHLDPRGVAVVVEAKHMCMCARGVGKQKSSMVTSAMRGVFRQPAARAEFFKLVEVAKNGR
jgi:GTP cyclohydrolase I